MMAGASFPQPGLDLAGDEFCTACPKKFVGVKARSLKELAITVAITTG